MKNMNKMMAFLLMITATISFLVQGKDKECSLAKGDENTITIENNTSKDLRFNIKYSHDPSYRPSSPSKKIEEYIPTFGLEIISKSHSCTQIPLYNGYDRISALSVINNIVPVQPHAHGFRWFKLYIEMQMNKLFRNKDKHDDIYSRLYSSPYDQSREISFELALDGLGDNYKKQDCGVDGKFMFNDSNYDLELFCRDDKGNILGHTVNLVVFK